MCQRLLVSNMPVRNRVRAQQLRLEPQKTETTLILTKWCLQLSFVTWAVSFHSSTQWPKHKTVAAVGMCWSCTTQFVRITECCAVCWHLINHWTHLSVISTGFPFAFTKLFFLNFYKISVQLVAKLNQKKISWSFSVKGLNWGLCWNMNEFRRHTPFNLLKSHMKEDFYLALLSTDFEYLKSALQRNFVSLSLKHLKYKSDQKLEAETKREINVCVCSLRPCRVSCVPGSHVCPSTMWCLL